MRKKRKIYLKHYSEFEIPFFDVDSMFIMWHGHYVKYLEMARCDFLNSINYHYDIMREKCFAYPIVKLNLKYIKPAKFRQRIQVEVQLTEYNSYLEFYYIIRDVETKMKLTEGSTTQVAVNMRTTQMEYQIPQDFQNTILEQIKRKERNEN